MHNLAMMSKYVICTLMKPVLYMSTCSTPAIRTSDKLMERTLGVFEGKSFQDARNLLDWEALPEPRHLYAWDLVLL